jgi:hypothetical protein
VAVNSEKDFLCEKGTTAVTAFSKIYRTIEIPLGNYSKFKKYS